VAANTRNNRGIVAGVYTLSNNISVLSQHVFHVPGGVVTYSGNRTSVNLKLSLVLTGRFIFKPVSQFVERYHRVLSWALNMEDLISSSFVNLLSNKEISSVF
jgi:hypothetical protein